MNSISNINSFNYSVKSDTAELGKIRQFIAERAANFGFDEEAANKIVLAVDEACSNLIRHAYGFDPEKVFIIEIETQGRVFIVRIIDNSKPFNPTEVNPPNMSEYFNKFKKGGLGIHLMRMLMDEITYMPASHNNPSNVLTMSKSL